MSPFPNVPYKKGSSRSRGRPHDNPAANAGARMAATTAAAPHTPGENRLLGRMSEAARNALSLVRVDLPRNERLTSAGQPTRYVYFPVSGAVSLVSTTARGDGAEVALVGRDGLVGMGALLGSALETNTAIVQIPGEALRAEAANVRRARLEDPTARAVLDLYTEARLIQAAQTAVCNRLHTVDARLAKSLLGLMAASGTSRFRVSHESFAQIVGAQRPTVSTALSRFVASGLIAYDHRDIVVSTRQGLHEVACECVDTLQYEFDRLLGGPLAAGEPDLPASYTLPQAGIAIEMMREVAGRLLMSSLHEHEMRERAETTNEERFEALTMVAQELRDPLVAILEWCTILADRHGDVTRRGVSGIRRSATAQLEALDHLETLLAVGGRVSARPADRARSARRSAARS